jgi:hypothetical protein
MNGIWKNVETQIEKPHSKDWGFFLSIMKRYVFYSWCMNGTPIHSILIGI